MENITNGTLDFKSLEKRIFSMVCSLGCKIIEEYLHMWDNRIMALRDTEMYRSVNSGTTTIKTVMGEVRHTRRCYRRKTGGHVFLLDEALGLEGGCGLVSENLAEQIILECVEKSFRKAAESISSLTGQAISAMGAWGVLQRFGEKLDRQEERLRELDQQGEVGLLGKIISQVLFAEMDEVWLSMQNETRCRNSETTKPEKAGKKPIHVGTAYTGWIPTWGGRYALANKFAYAGFGSSAEFGTSFEMLLRQRYDMDGVEKLLMGGDGAGWIKVVAEENDAIFQLDPFHRNRAILRAVSDKEDRNHLFGAIRDKEVDELLTTITGLIAQAPDESARKKLEELYTYFYNNKEYLLTWQERGITLPEPPEGVVYREMGTQEASNSTDITQRMKHRKGSWSTVGGGHMAKILCFRHTIGLNEALGMLPEPSKANRPSDILSAAKAPIYDGKGNGGDWLYAPMPFAQVFTTNGREAIKGLLSLRRVSDLAFL